jgi:hypothetical protein
VICLGKAPDYVRGNGQPSLRDCSDFVEVYPGLRPELSSAVPSGLFRLRGVYPGLRPGLSSAVPSGLFDCVWFRVRIPSRLLLGEWNCRSLHGRPGQVGFARDDKGEGGVSHLGSVARVRRDFRPGCNLPLPGGSQVSPFVVQSAAVWAPIAVLSA